MFSLCAGAFFSLVYALTLLLMSSASYVNYTIDNAAGDARTGVLPQYTSTSTNLNSTWFSNAECVPKVSNLCPKAFTNGSSVFNMTWHASWGPSNMTLNFNGTAIYIYMVIPGYPGSDVEPLGLNTSFVLDGEYIYTLENIPRIGELPHEELAFNVSQLESGTHQLTVVANPHVQSNNVSISTFTAFSRALYTLDVVDGTADRTTEQTSAVDKPKIIIAATITGIGALFVILVLCVFCSYRRRRAARLKELTQANPYSNPTPSLLDRTKSQFSVKVKLRRSAAYELLRDLELPLKVKRSQIPHARTGSEILPLVTEQIALTSLPFSSQAVPPMPSVNVAVASAGYSHNGRRRQGGHAQQISYAFPRPPPTYDEVLSATEEYDLENSLASVSDTSPLAVRQNMVYRWVKRMSRDLFGGTSEMHVNS